MHIFSLYSSFVFWSGLVFRLFGNGISNELNLLILLWGYFQSSLKIVLVEFSIIHELLSITDFLKF